MKKFLAGAFVVAALIGGSLVAVAPAQALTPSDVVPTATTTETANCHGGQTANVYKSFALFDNDTFTLSLTNCNSHYAKPSTWDYGNVYTKVNNGNGGTGVRNPNTYALGNDQQCLQQNATVPGSWTGLPYGFTGMKATMTSSIVSGTEPYIYLYDMDPVCGGGNFWHSKQLVYTLYPVTPTVTAAFGAGSVGTNTDTSLTVTLTNTQIYRAETRGTFSGLGFDIALPTGASLDTAVATGTCGGTVSQTTVSSINTFRFTGGSLGNTNDSCTVVVPVAFPSTGTVTLNGASLKASSSNKSVLINNLSASITVSNAPTSSIAPATQAPSLTVGEQMTSTTAFTPTGFTGTIVYSISPDLPAGLLFDTATGVISGTPTTAQASADYTVTASDGTNSATATVSIGIASPPPALLPATQTIDAHVGTAVNTSVIDTTTMPCQANMTISPNLPAGLAFDAVTGVISGTPTEVATSGNYVVSYDCGGGNPYTSTVTLSVGAASVLDEVSNLVNTGLALLGPAGIIALLIAIGAPFFFVSERFRKIRTAALVFHKSSHVTITSPATFFDRLRGKN